jgi:hypothetical protein
MGSVVIVDLSLYTSTVADLPQDNIDMRLVLQTVIATSRIVVPGDSCTMHRLHTRSKVNCVTADVKILAAPRVKVVTALVENVSSAESRFGNSRPA